MVRHISARPPHRRPRLAAQSAVLILGAAAATLSVAAVAGNSQCPDPSSFETSPEQNPPFACTYDSLDTTRLEHCKGEYTPPDGFEPFTRTCLDLSNVGLMSIAPGAFDDIPTLQQVFAAGNALKTVGNATFASNTQLESVDLSHNALTELPQGIFANARQLETVLLNDNHLQQLPPDLFLSMPRVVSVDVSNNPLASLPAPMFATTETTSSAYLSFRNCRLTAVRGDVFGGLKLGDGYYGTDGVHIDLSNNDIEGTLDATVLSSIDGIMDRLATFNASHNAITALSGPGFFGPGNPTTVDLSYNALGSAGDSGIDATTFRQGASSQARSTTAIDLSHNKLTVFEVGTFAGQVALASLNVSYNELTGVDFLSSNDAAAGDEAGADAANVDADADTDVGSAGTAVTATLPALTHLYASGNRITSLGDGALSACPRLAYVNLSDNALTAVAASAFGSGGTVSHLDLSKNSIQQLPAETFAQVPLTELHMEDNDLAVLPAGVFTVPGPPAVVLSFARNPRLASVAPTAFAGQHVTALDLSDCALDQVPAGLFGTAVAGLWFCSLRNLSLAGNALTAVGADVLLLRRRACGEYYDGPPSVDLSRNNITHVGAPPSSGDDACVYPQTAPYEFDVLNVSFNAALGDAGLAAITACTAGANYLDASGCGLTTFPALSQFQETLAWVKVSHNHIRTLHLEGQATDVRYTDLTSNDVTLVQASDQWFFPNQCAGSPRYSRHVACTMASTVLLQDNPILELGCPAYHCPVDVLMVAYNGPSASASGAVSQRHHLTVCEPLSVGFTCSSGLRPTVCPQGHYCPPRTQTGNKTAPTIAAPVACPPGTEWGTKAYAGPFWSLDNCTSCVAGRYNPVPASRECEVCPSGYACPPGTANATAAANKCTAGEMCRAGCVPPPQQSLPKGTGTSTGAASDERAPMDVPVDDDSGGNRCRVPCPAGRYCPDTRTSDGSGYPCPAGSFCPVGSGAPTLCTAGTTCTCQGGCSAATPCDAGHFCSDPSQQPQPCGAGYACPAGTSAAHEHPCPTGTYCPPQATAPTVCPPGKYCSDPSQQPLPCPAGYVCGPGTKEADDPANACAAGTYCLPGAISPTVCPPGHYCADPSQLPQKCAAGFYRGEPGAASSSDCHAAPPGAYAGAGATQPWPCEENTYNTRAAQATCLGCELDWGCTHPGTIVPYPAPPAAPTVTEAAGDSDGGTGGRGLVVRWTAQGAASLGPAPYDTVKNYTVTIGPKTGKEHDHAVAAVMPGASASTTFLASELDPAALYSIAVVVTNGGGMATEGYSTSVSLSCPGDGACSNQGTCTAQKTCDCDTSWRGADCSYWAIWKVCLTVLGGVATTVSCVAGVFKLRGALRSRGGRRARRATDSNGDGRDGASYRRLDDRDASVAELPTVSRGGGRGTGRGDRGHAGASV